MFKFRNEKNLVRTEVIAALTTFFTVSYILIVNPQILGSVGLPYDSVFVATAIAAGFSSILMGIFADRPFALASGMGLNAYFAYSVMGGMGFGYGSALAAVFFSGALMAIISISKFDFGGAVPESFKHALIGGLGLFMVFIGMQNSHFIRTSSATIVSLGDLGQPAALIAIIGFFITALFVAKRVNGALFFGVAITTVFSMLLGLVPFPAKMVSMPPSISDTLFKVDFSAAFDTKIIPVVWTFFIIAFFDAFGTITALGTNPKFWSRSDEKKAKNTAMAVNSVGSMLGALLGVPTVTTYLESASGINSGGRTGLVAIIVGLLFLLSLFFFPLITAIPIEAAAPAIIIVGLFMVSGIGSIRYSDQTESIPALLTLGTIPFTYSIAYGIGVGSISYVFLKIVTGRAKDVHPAMYFIALLSVLNFAHVFG